jgi:hypothetical protein
VNVLNADGVPVIEIGKRKKGKYRQKLSPLR